jgi:hypothetical protein
MRKTRQETIYQTNISTMNAIGQIFWILTSRQKLLSEHGPSYPERVTIAKGIPLFSCQETFVVALYPMEIKQVTVSKIAIKNIFGRLGRKNIDTTLMALASWTIPISCLKL